MEEEPWRESLADIDLGSLLEHLPICAFRERVDPNSYPDSALVYRSPHAEVVTGYRLEEYGEASARFYYEEILHPEERERVWAEGQRTIVTGEFYEQEYRIIHKQGHVVWVREIARLLEVDESGAQVWDGLLIDITDRKQTELRLHETADRLEMTDRARRTLLRDLVHAEEAERKRIAEDLHDDSVQHLTTLALRLDLLRRGLSDDQEAAAGQMQETLQGVIAGLRRLMFDLRPGVIEGDQLSAALHQKLQEVEIDTGVSTTFLGQLDSPPSAAAATIAYRLASECLNNARKHAQASAIEVEVTGGANGVEIKIRDDGVGFDPDGVEPNLLHMGLPSMRGRAESAGGWLECRSEPGSGTLVTFWIPS